MAGCLIRRDNLTSTIELLHTAFVEVLRSYGRVGYVHTYIPGVSRLLLVVIVMLNQIIATKDYQYLALDSYYFEYSSRYKLAH